MDAPPYGRAVSDAPPHSGLSPIAVFRHYSSRHLICIVPFFTQRPFASTGIAPFPRYYGLVRLLLSLSLHAVLPSSLAELSEHAILLCPARALAGGFAVAYGDLPSGLHPSAHCVSSAQASSAESCWLHVVRTLATRDLSNETSRERFTYVVAYSFVWRDSRTSVTLCTPHHPNCMLTSLQCRLLSFC